MNKKVKKHFKYKAFTLAEVLITLGIIGVVAEMTIPTLVQNFQKQTYVTSLKKIYTTFNQALQQVSTDSSCIGDLACTGLFASGTTNQTLGQGLVGYFKVAKDCGVGAGCWASIINSGYDGTGSNLNISAGSAYKFIIADGASIAISTYATSYSPNCENSWSTGKLGYMSQTCGYIYVDANGTKPPNRIGMDVFGFWITNGKGPLLYPDGGMDDKATGASNRWWPTSCRSSSSYQCTGRVVEKGWEIDY